MPDPVNGRPVTPRNTAMGVAAGALKAQQSRMRIIAENIATAESTANVAGGQPYRRQTPVFDDSHPFGVTQSMVDFMQHQHHRQIVFLVQTPQKIQQLKLMAHIQKGGRLIQKQHLRLLRQRQRQPGPLPLAAG